MSQPGLSSSKTAAAMMTDTDVSNQLEIAVHMLRVSSALLPQQQHSGALVLMMIDDCS
jgi:hypothetical protein